MSVAGNWMRQFLDHHQVRTAGRPAPHGQIVHECAHQEDSAPGRAQQVFFRQRILDLGKFEAAALVDDVHDHCFRLQFDGKVNLFALVLAIAVVIGVDHALADGHAELVQIVFAEARFLGHARDDVFCEVHAFKLRIERDLKTLVCGRHGAQGKTPIKTPCMGITAAAQTSNAAATPPGAIGASCVGNSSRAPGLDLLRLYCTPNTCGGACGIGSLHLDARARYRVTLRGPRSRARLSECGQADDVEFGGFAGADIDFGEADVDTKDGGAASLEQHVRQWMLLETHTYPATAGLQASERDSSKPAPSFFSIFSISADSRISPQSRHSTYWASLSFAISWVRWCGQVGFVIVASMAVSSTAPYTRGHGAGTAVTKRSIAGLTKIGIATICLAGSRI